MRIEASEDKLQYAIEVCRKYSKVRIIAEEAEASWKRNLEMVAESKYPDEKEMYEQQAAEELAKYTAAREWLELVLGAAYNIQEFRAQEVVRQHCLNKVPLKAVVFENGRCMGKTAVFYYKKIGLTHFSEELEKLRGRLEEKEKIFREC